MQRLLDILFSGIAIIFLSPILLLTIFLLRITGEGEIFYLQERIGLNRDKFKLYKFTTMLKNSENMGTGTLTLKDDFRILPLGKFLRKTKINELPQLFNIFNGDMSVIGPRPQTERCFNAFSKDAQSSIISVRPGLSGIGSVIFRDEHEMTANQTDPDHFYDNVIMAYKGDLEIWYANNQNIYLYFILIGLTLWTVIFSSSNPVWFFFKGLPEVPNELQQWI